MRNEALEFPKDTGHAFVSQERNAKTSKKLCGFVDPRLALIAPAEPTLTENTMALPQRVGFKAETVDEKGIWCPCTVEDISKDSVIISFDGQNVDWNRCTCDSREIRNRTVFKGAPNCKATIH